jgi:hypothetical protein
VTSRWEQGSYFGLPDLSRASPLDIFPPTAKAYASGRVALVQLLRVGRESRGWNKVWIPSYYCEDVVNTLSNFDLIEIDRYGAGPYSNVSVPAYSPGAVLLTVNYFGWGVASGVAAWPGDIIEDHTHDPLALTDSKAQFAFASLRKYFPVPDGAVCFSPKGYELPIVPTRSAEHDCAVYRKLAAMALKTAYLNGDIIEKSAFRALELDAEDRLSCGHPAEMSDVSKLVLSAISLKDLREAKQRNFRALEEALSSKQDIKLLSLPGRETHAYAVLRLKDQTLRDPLREFLVGHNIYTVVFWPEPEGMPDWYREEDRAFSASTLVVHIDYRYQVSDMIRVGENIQAGFRTMVNQK